MNKAIKTKYMGEDLHNEVRGIKHCTWGNVLYLCSTTDEELNHPEVNRLV